MKKILIVSILAVLLCGCTDKEDITEYKVNEAGEAVQNEKERIEYKNPDKITLDKTKSDSENIQSIISSMALDEKIGQLFIAVPECVDTDGGAAVYFTQTIKDNINKYNLGGIVFFSQNIVSAEQISELLSSMQECAKYNMFLCVDEEGGNVTRVAKNDNIDVKRFPPMAEIKSGEKAYEVGSTIGKYLGELGFNTDFAPVCDVLTNDKNEEIGTRAFSDDAQIVSSMSGEVIRGLKSNNICTAAKHFPGHGDAEQNSHNGYSQTLRTYEQMKECEFIPFENAKRCGADFMLVSHISAPDITQNDVPCSLSEKIYDIMRNDIGYDGIAITDALNMGAVTQYYSGGDECLRAFSAGADMLLMPSNIDEGIEKIKEAVNSGEISAERLNESLERILRVKIERGIIS